MIHSSLVANISLSSKRLRILTLPHLVLVLRVKLRGEREGEEEEEPGLGEGLSPVTLTLLYLLVGTTCSNVAVEREREGG